MKNIWNKKIYTEAMSDFLSSLNIERNTIPVINDTPKLKIQLKRPDLQETAVQASSSPNSASSQLPPVTPHKLQLAQQSPSTNMDSDIPSSTVTGEQSQQNELRKEKPKLKLKRQEEEPQPNEGNIQSIPPSSTPQLTKSLTQSKYTTNEKSFPSPLWGFAKKLLFLCLVLFIAVYAWNKITKKMNQSYAEKSKIYQKYTALYPRKP